MRLTGRLGGARWLSRRLCISAGHACSAHPAASAGRGGQACRSAAGWVRRGVGGGRHAHPAGGGGGRQGGGRGGGGEGEASVGHRAEGRFPAPVRSGHRAEGTFPVRCAQPLMDLGACTPQIAPPGPPPPTNRPGLPPEQKPPKTPPPSPLADPPPPPPRGLRPIVSWGSSWRPEPRSPPPPPPGALSGRFAVRSGLLGGFSRGG